MIKPFTCLCMLMAAGSGLYLYQIKNRTRLLDRQVAQVMKTADATRARTGVLQAEWALQNDPERLADLANRFLTLKPLTPTQFVTLAELDHRLPTVEAVAPPGGENPEPAADPAAAIDLRPDPLPAVAKAPPPVASPPATAPVAPPQVAAARPLPATAVAVRAAQPRPAANPPIAQVSALTSPAAGATAAEVIGRIMRGGRVDPSVPAVASVLGAARGMIAAPVPVPIASAQAAGYPGMR